MPRINVQPQLKPTFSDHLDDKLFISLMNYRLWMRETKTKWTQNHVSLVFVSHTEKNTVCNKMSNTSKIQTKSDVYF